MSLQMRHLLIVRLRICLSCILIQMIAYFFLSSNSQAISYPILSQRELLARCYIQITGNRLGFSSDLWERLKNENATSICYSLLKNLSFDDQGMLTQSESKLNRSILKQFIDFHRTWFAQQWSQDNSFPETFWGGVDVYDPQEPALFLTRNLILEQSYSKVIFGKSTAVAIRDGSKLKEKLSSDADGFLRASRILNSHEGPIINSNNIFYANPEAPSDKDYKFLPSPLIQIGEPVGIKLVSYLEGPLLPTIWTGVNSNSLNAFPQGFMLPYPYLANHGGGALGSIPYIMFNFGHGFDFKADGAAKLPRRYILSVFKNLLCRQGPFLRSSDVSSWKTDLIDSPAFRKSESCLRCHVTLDQASLVLRNFRLGSTTNGLAGNNDYRSPPILAKYESDENVSINEFWPKVAQSDFYKTKANGVLYFRSITGDLINFQMDSLETLGQSLATTPDYYACAAKRYFEFFTHNKVELYDPGDPSNEQLNESLTPHDHEMKQFVLSLGKELKNNGSLKKMVKRIIDSDFYSRGNFGL